MSSLWSSSYRLVVSQWRSNRANRRYWILPHSRRISTFVPSPVSSSHDDNSSSPKNPHGIVTCHQCLGDCVRWEESIDEQSWEKARSISPLAVKEDDEFDNFDIKLVVRRKTKRVYHPTAPESLNVKTGIFSNRMKLIHGDPMLRAQRAAAIKKTKWTAAARKRASESMKNYFRDPENRHMRSIAMKELKFYCHNCGCEVTGDTIVHKLQFELHSDSSDAVCVHEKGHNIRTCRRPKTSEQKIQAEKIHHCKICGQSGHNRRTCPHLAEVESTFTVNEDALSPEGPLHAVCLEKKGTKQGIVHPENDHFRTYMASLTQSLEALY